MSAGVRSCLTAGVALASAGLIVAAPIAPANTAAHAINARVQLAAVPSPLVLYPQVLVRSVQNTAALAEAYFSDPLPLIRVTLEKQGAALAVAFDAIAAGDPAGAVRALGDVLLQPLRTAFGAIEYFGTLVDQPDAPGALFQIAFSPLLSGIAAFGVAIDDVIDAAMAFDLVGLVNAVINIPARVIDGVLNGGYGSPFGDFDNLPGLLTPLTVEGYLAPGPIGLAISVEQDAADYIEDQDDADDSGDTAVPDAVTTDDSGAQRISAVDTVDDVVVDEPEPLLDEDEATEDAVETAIADEAIEQELEVGDDDSDIAPPDVGTPDDTDGIGDTDVTDDTGETESVDAA